MASRFAEGTRKLDIGTPKRSYRVRIMYREPEYERRTRPRAEPFRYTFSIDSGSEDDAVAKAVAEFREVERQSSVGWTREIVGIDVRVAEPTS